MASWSYETPLQLRIITCYVGFKSFGFQLEMEVFLNFWRVLDSSLNWKFSRTSGTVSWTWLSCLVQDVLGTRTLLPSFGLFVNCGSLSFHGNGSQTRATILPAQLPGQG